MDLITKASEVYAENFEPVTWFERAVFLGWYCSKADCKFCYMSTQKSKIKNPRLSRRTIESILAEVYLCKMLGWEIEFLSSGYNSYDFEELVKLVSTVRKFYGKKLWLNVGSLDREELNYLGPHLEGVCGAVETINLNLRKKLCPSKPIDDILRMFDEAKNLKKAITIIIGLGENLNDIPKLHKFIESNEIDKVVFYALKPQKGTIFRKEPDSFYYAGWIAETRIRFPKLYIVAGTGVNRVAETSLLLKAGANSITKFPSIRLFNSDAAKAIEEECKLAGRRFRGTLTDTSLLDNLKIESNIRIKLNDYIRVMKKSR